MLCGRSVVLATALPEAPSSMDIRSRLGADTTPIDPERGLLSQPPLWR